MKNILVAVSTLVVALTMMPQASALSVSSELYTLSEPTVENVYLMGGTLTIKAPVTGDIVAFGGDIIIEAPITGDLLIAGGTVSVQNNIEGDIRVAASQVAISNSHVSGDIIYAGSRLSMDTLSSSSGSLMATAAQVVLQGTTSGSVEINASDLTFGGQHQGPVELRTQQLSFLGGATVASDLLYSASEVKDSGAVTAGSMQEQEIVAQTWYEILLSSLQMSGYLFFAILFLALVVVRSTPNWSKKVTERMYKKAPSSVFIGIFLLLSFPSTIGFVLGLQLIFAPYAVVFLPLIICVGVVGLLLLLLSPAMIALYLGGLLPKVKGEHMPTWSLLLIGSLLLAVLVSLPYVGLLIAAWFTSLAIGAMAQSKTRFLGVFEKRVKSKKVE